MPSSKSKAVRTGRNKALEYHDACHSCAQSAVMALQDALEMENDAVARASTAMTGGIAGQGDVCGALLGAVMIVSMVHGVDRQSLKNVEKLVNTMVKTRELYDWFVQKYGTTNCKRMVTDFGNGVFYDMGTPEGWDKAVETGVLEQCARVIEATVAHVVETIWEDVHAVKP